MYVFFLFFAHDVAIERHHALVVSREQIDGIEIKLALHILFALSFLLHSLTPAPCHLVGKSLFTVLPDVADARGTVRTEHKGENLSDEICVCLAPCHILATFSAGFKTMLVYTRPDFAPRSPVVEPASGASLREILPACTAVKAACSY